MTELIEFKLNGKTVKLNVDSDRTLLWVLRTDFGLTGTKYGCGEGFCGSCTVLINDNAERSCSITIKSVKGKEVTTIEGLMKNGRLHPLQKAFAANDSLQCGYCTPGMIMNAYALLKKNRKPTYNEIIKEMDNNFCRCAAHKRIVHAIQTASVEMK
jgi:aerobic-type carbon monoxide dehydrogenase small subunit (CoxS/CutS family)